MYIWLCFFLNLFLLAFLLDPKTWVVCGFQIRELRNWLNEITYYHVIFGLLNELPQRYRTRIFLIVCFRHQPKDTNAIHNGFWQWKEHRSSHTAKRAQITLKLFLYRSHYTLLGGISACDRYTRLGINLYNMYSNLEPKMIHN